MWEFQRRMAPDDAAGGGGSAAGGGAGGAAAAAAVDPGKLAGGGAAAAGPGAKPAGTGGAAASAGANGAAAADAGKATEKAGFWPENWRETVAGDDTKVLERLRRYGSPNDVAKALISAQNRISSGELKPALGKNASAEEIAEWRAAHGVPESAEKYDLDLGGGLVVGDEDKELVKTFLTAAHKANMSQDQTKAALRAYYEITDAAEAARSAKDVETREKCEDALRTEWGSEFRPNINRVTQLLDRVMPKEAKEEFMNARFADGTPVFNSPDIMKAMVSLSLIENPAGVVVPAGGAGASSIDDEIAKIEKMMGTKAYTSDEKVQQRYRDLIDARERMAGRKAA